MLPGSNLANDFPDNVPHLPVSWRDRHSNGVVSSVDVVPRRRSKPCHPLLHELRGSVRQQLKEKQVSNARRAYIPRANCWFSSDVEGRVVSERARKVVIKDVVKIHILMQGRIRVSPQTPHHSLLPSTHRGIPAGTPVQAHLPRPCVFRSLRGMRSRVLAHCLPVPPRCFLRSPSVFRKRSLLPGSRRLTRRCMRVQVAGAVIS